MTIIKKNINKLLVSLGILLSVSCSSDVNVMQVDEANYQVSSNNYAMLSNNNGLQVSDSISFSTTGSTGFFVQLQKASDADAVFELTYNEAILTEYNSKHASQYKALPTDLVQLPTEIKINKGATKSAEAKVSYNTAANLDSLGTYAIPLSIKVKSGNVMLSEKQSSFVLLVNDLSKMPNCDKSTGIKIVSCMEVNDCNPLNNLCFTLKKSGKPLIDMVILFSANINYNVETGQVYIYNNDNVRHLLSNKEKYLKPLQDKGIKVVLGILGNHDASGIANLTPKGAKLFAKEIKEVLDAYQLDGVFFDDEYSKYSGAPGFEPSPSSEAAARLCYETKKAIGDKIVSVYVYGRTSSLPAVDGVQSGNFVDYALHDYGRSSDLSNNYPGMPKSRMGLYSQEYNRGYWANTAGLQRIRTEGYGCHMIFAMDPFRRNFSYGQIPSMQKIAKELFDDELVYNNKPYRKDW